MTAAKLSGPLLSRACVVAVVAVNRCRQIEGRRRRTCLVFASWLGRISVPWATLSQEFGGTMAEHDDVALGSVWLEVTGHGAQRLQARLGLIEVVDPEFEMELDRHVLLRPGRRLIPVDMIHPGTLDRLGFGGRSSRTRSRLRPGMPRRDHAAGARAGPQMGRGDGRPPACSAPGLGAGADLVRSAEGVGFEPTRSKLLAVFKTAAIGH